MQEGYVEVAGVPTHIYTWGKWIEDPFKENEEELCICITGNPGLPGFYSTFASTIYEALDKKVPVWVIGMSGHDNPPKRFNMKVPELVGNERLYNLKGQVCHKAEFINKYVPEDVKINLIGHSIGSYVSLELLKRPSIKNRVKKEYLLFPTFERMAESPNGRKFTTFFPTFMWGAVLLFWLFSLLPYKVRAVLIYLYFMLFNIPKYFVGTAVKYARPSVVQKVLTLAVDEMEIVDKLDTDLIEQNQKLLTFYYGSHDGWAPASYYYDLKQQFPKIDAHLCNRGMSHAFCLRSGPEMGYIIAEWIKGGKKTK